jgi:hypothetical protein
VHWASLVYLSEQSCRLRSCQVSRKISPVNRLAPKSWLRANSIVEITLWNTSRKPLLDYEEWIILVAWELAPSRNILRWLQRPFLWCLVWGTTAHAWLRSRIAIVVRQEEKYHRCLRMTLDSQISVEVACWRRAAGRASARVAATLKMSWKPVFTGFGP